MKMPRRTLRAGQGVVILACLIGTLVISLMLVGMLLTVENENAMASRSQAWNRSLVVAEAGIEEGLALVNQNVGTSTTLTNWPSTATSDGWTLISNNTYHIQRQMSGDPGYYDAYVSVGGDSNNIPTITSTGTVVWTGPTGATNLLSRTVRVTTTCSTFTQSGPLVLADINMSGGGLIDGYDSQDPSLSSNGQYDPSLITANFNVTVLTNNLNPAVSLGGSALIHAHVNVGPNDGISVSGGAGIGDISWAGPGIEAGWTHNTVNLDPVPDASAPAGVSWQPLPTETNGTYVLTGFGPGVTNYYLIPQASDKKNQNYYNCVFLVTNGPVVLLATNFNLQGGQASIPSSITVAGDATLQFYLSGSDSISGQGVVNNAGYADNVILWGLPSCTNLTYSGNSAFAGLIYAPETSLNWSSGAPGYGDFTVYSYDDSGQAPFHVDLGTINPSLSPGGYFVTSWREVLP